MDDWDKKRLNLAQAKNRNQFMNAPEKIAATYLRLNGFLLLPHFTIFTDRHHNHVDLIGYRPRNSEECVSDVPLKRDDDFSNKIEELQNDDTKTLPTGIIVQVRGNTTYPKFHDNHEEYVERFLGIKPVRIIFRRQKKSIFIKEENENRSVCVGLKHSFGWIQERIGEMHSYHSKTGSWTLSEEFLADLLLIRRIGCDQYEM